MSIKAKIVLLIFLAALMGLFEALTSFWSNQTISAIQAQMQKVEQEASLTAQLNVAVLYRGKLQAQMLIPDLDEELLKSFIQSNYDSLEASRPILADLDALVQSKQGRAFYEEVVELGQQTFATLSTFLPMIQDGFLEDAAEVYLQQFIPIQTKFTEVIAKWSEHNQQALAALREETRIKNQNVQLISMVLAIVGIAIIMVAGVMIGNNIVFRLCRLENLADDIAQTGDLHKRIEIDGIDSIATVATKVQHVFGISANALQEVSRVLAAMRSGDLTQRIQGEFIGDLSHMQQEFNATLDNLECLLLEISTMAKTLRKGQVGVLIEQDFVGIFGEVKDDLNGAANMLNRMVGDISHQMQFMSQGHFDKRLNTEMRGSFDTLKGNMNQTFDFVDSFVTEIAAVAALQSSGNLTGLVKGDYKGMVAGLKDAINNAQANLVSIICQVLNAAGKLEVTSKGIAVESAGLSDRFNAQLQDMDQAVATLNTMVQSIGQTANQTDTTIIKSRAARQAVDEGQGVMGLAQKAMDEITESSHKIADITKLIDSIAFQTNLLALNAAVEAARAGEHGRGFAVVASEVRSLAQKTADAAKDISNLINETVGRVAQGSDYVRKTASALNRINDEIDGVTQIMDQLALNAKKQVSEAEEINQMVTQMAQSTRDNVEGINNARDSAFAMEKLANYLDTSVQRFVLPEISELEQKIIYAKHLLIDAGIKVDFDAIKGAHRAWKAKIRAFVEGKDIGVSYEVATDPTKCALGKWYYSEGQSFIHLESMSQLGEAHANMHKTLGVIMDAKKAGDDALVESKLLDVDRFSEQVIMLIDRTQLELADSLRLANERQNLTRPGLPHQP